LGKVLICMIMAQENLTFLIWNSEEQELNGGVK